MGVERQKWSRSHVVPTGNVFLRAAVLCSFQANWLHCGQFSLQDPVARGHITR